MALISRPFRKKKMREAWRGRRCDGAAATRGMKNARPNSFEVFQAGSCSIGGQEGRQSPRCIDIRRAAFRAGRVIGARRIFGCCRSCSDHRKHSGSCTMAKKAVSAKAGVRTLHTGSNRLPVRLSRGELAGRTRRPACLAVRRADRRVSTEGQVLRERRNNCARAPAVVVNGAGLQRGT